MKKLTLILTAAMLMPLLTYGQNIDDALRYSQTFYQGTARFNGMGGAFTALGGDMSAILVNPASAAIFRSSEFSITPTLTFRNTSTNYMQSTVENPASYFNLGQIGFVSAFTVPKGTGLKGMSFAYTYNRTSNFNKYAIIEGVSDSSSIADYLASQADGYTSWELKKYWYERPLGYLGYMTYLTDTVPGVARDYSSVFSFYDEYSYYYGQKVTRVIDNTGNMGEHTFTIGGNWGDKLYLGAALGISRLSYTGHVEHTETDENDRNPWFNSLTFTDHFTARSTGVNFKVGAILKPVESLRLGLSFQTPTVYRIHEIYYSTLTSLLDFDATGYDENYFEAETGESTYSYRFATPYKLNVGVGLQLGTFALLSADYEFLDYTTAKFSRGEGDYTFNNENSDIRSELRSASNIRLGAEIRLGSLYVRGGYRYYGSSFKAGSDNEDWNYQMISGGIGYRQKSFYLDFAMSGLVSSETYYMYNDPWLDPAHLSNSDKILTATVGLKF